jgi:hypothetical protein
MKEADLQVFWLNNKKSNTTERSMKTLNVESFHQKAKKVRAFTCFVYWKRLICKSFGWRLRESVIVKS